MTAGIRMPKRIWLIGFPFAGKSTVGAALAKRLDWSLTDTDALIPELKDGQMYDSDAGFRISEAVTVATVAEWGEPRVIATGGGVPVMDISRQVMRSTGVVVWLDVDEPELEQRAHKRDPEGKRVKLVDKIPLRLRLYADTAHYKVPSGEMTIEETTEFIVDKLKWLHRRI